jgi:hypothetical protein
MPDSIAIASILTGKENAKAKARALLSKRGKRIQYLGGFTPLLSAISVCGCNCLPYSTVIQYVLLL